MTPRQEAIVAALRSGPQSTEDLVYAAGYNEVTRRTVAYVTVTVHRLGSRHGYVISNDHRPGSHHRGLYTLVSVPEQARRCCRCGTVLARDHRGDVACSPCLRALIETELAGVTA